MDNIQMDDIQKRTASQVYNSLKTRAEGLTPEEAGSRVILSEEKTDTMLTFLRWAGKITRQFTHFFALLLWSAALLCFFVEHFQPGEGMGTLGYTILLVIVINGAFSFIQEYRAEKATQALKKLLPVKVKVLRTGAVAEVPLDLLVEGDMALLEEGDRAPADIRLVESHNLKVSNATLTGESDVLTRVADPSTADSLFNAENIVFSGTLVLSGRARGVVFATGRRSQFGRVAGLTTGIRKTLSPLEKEIKRVSRTITLIAVSLGSAFFILGLLMDRSVWDNLLFAVGILVALVPEGLLPTVTLTLAAGSQRMARRNALVKELNAIETLGCTTVICTDKTGTITENNMRVERMWLPENVPEAGDDAYLVMGLANSLSFTAESGNQPGDPMEEALIRAAWEYFDRPAGPPRAARLEEFGFTPERKRMTVLYRVEGRDGLFAATKGAPETVLPLCRLTGGELRRVEEAAAGMARQAMRVIALACRAGSAGGGLAGEESEQAAVMETWEQDMTFLGLVGLADPVRADVPEAVAVCRTAGIRVMLITGDAATTACAVARSAGIVPGDAEPAVLTGDTVTAMGVEDLKDALRSSHIVFARMQPEHKLKVVAALQEMGEVVAMTGDGVNDAPALRKSDIGVAMGLRGTDVARESADMVLLDDHFATIVSAVEEGRAVFSNIRKFMTYFFASNTPELVPFLAYVLLGIPLPLSIIQIMAIDLGTDMLPALALGLEKPRREMMLRPPRSREERLLTPGLLFRAYVFLGIIESVAGMAGYFYVLLKGGWQWGQPLSIHNVLYLQATTACLAGIILAQMANLFACRSEIDSAFRVPLKDNPFILWGLLWELGVLLLLVYTGPAHVLFRTWPPPAGAWLILLLFPPLLLLLDETRKWLASRRRRDRALPDNKITL